jgi:phosphatidylserine/phosphatidylglycerophosphate/cardiolipin synthase-like enzyme
MEELSENDNNDNSQGSDSVHVWYDTMFSKAKDSIYIEDKFLFQDNAITKVLVNRLKEEGHLKIIAVGLMEPNVVGLAFCTLSKESINHVISNLSALRKAGENRVRIYSLISQHNTFKDRRKQIYIHSKLMIVDDKWITVGSANTDRDGLEYSTEFDLGIVSADLSRKLKVNLSHEHLKTSDFDSSYLPYSEDSILYNFHSIVGSTAKEGHINLRYIAIVHRKPS